MLDHMRTEGFIHTGHRVQPKMLDTVEEIIPYIFDAVTKGDASGDEDYCPHVKSLQPLKSPLLSGLFIVLLFLLLCFGSDLIRPRLFQD